EYAALWGNRRLNAAGIRDMNVGCSTGLQIGGVPATRLAEQYGTPLYVYDAGAIREAFLRIRGAVPYAPSRVHYACFANSNLAIRRIIREVGGGIHANTWGDAVMALQCEFAPHDIMYSGSNLDSEDMSNLFHHGVAINLNSLSQLRKYAQMLRKCEQAHPQK